MRNLIALLYIVILTGCDFSGNNYKDVTSSKNDLDFYELVNVPFKDGATSGMIAIPRFLEKRKPPNKDNIFQYSYFDNNTGYLISIEKLMSRNTQKLSDKEYIDIIREGFKKEMNGDLSEIERMLHPTMQNVKVIQFEGNLIIHDKYFFKRVSYYQDRDLAGTSLADVFCTNFQFVTVHNKTKYSINVNYYGDDKSASELVGLFNTIGGSVYFN
jgi:hypothetical protein